MATHEFLKANETLSVSSRRDFRKWLAKHHAKKKRIWLVLYKKSSGKQGVTPLDALEEAICYGWIDTRIRSINAERYAMQFVPRRKGSTWSEYNKGVALRMLRQGKMTRNGISVLPADLLRWRGQVGKKVQSTE